jgi:hypothetical protein
MSKATFIGKVYKGKASAVVRAYRNATARQQSEESRLQQNARQWIIDLTTDKMTLSGLATACGVDISYLSTVRSGKRSCSADVAIRIAKCLEKM